MAGEVRQRVGVQGLVSCLDGAEEGHLCERENQGEEDEGKTRKREGTRKRRKEKRSRKGKNLQG